jgi:diguanylate cyclase (GGDEF)-like protein
VPSTTGELPVTSSLRMPHAEMTRLVRERASVGVPGNTDPRGTHARLPGVVAFRVYLAVGLVAILGYYAVPSGIWQDVAYLALGVSGVCAILAGVRIHRPARRLPWLLMAAGQLTWVVGDALDSWFRDVEKVSTYPSLADAFYLGAYPVLGWALVLLIRRRRSSRDIAGLLDSAIVTAGLGVLSWVLLAHPTVLESEHSIAASAVGLAYPVADILLVGLLVRLVTTPGGRTPAFRLLLAAVGSLVLGDSAADLVSLVSSGTSAFDFLWLCSYVLWGAAALHPSMRTVSEPAPVPVLTFTCRRLIVLTVATLMAPGTLAVQLMLGTPVDGWAIVAGSVVLFLLVVARMNLAIDQIVASTRQREQLQADLAYQATHDSLTHLPNRASVLELIEGALHRAQRSSAIVGVLFVDLDGFKHVNDTFGHKAGDEVLCEVARRMQQQVRGGDVVARLGGDEFVVLLEPIDSQLAVLDIAQRLISVVSDPITANDAGVHVTVGASIGAAVSLDGDTNPDRLVGEADAAAYRAKSLGRGRVEVFDEALRRDLHERADLESAITRGLLDGEFFIEYQPVIDVRTNRLQGFEALVRWNRPGRGVVQPDQFIPVAEASTLICDLDCWVLGEALSQLARWSGIEGNGDFSMSVNVSGRHISDPRIVDDVAGALRRAGVDPRRLILEITETIRIDDVRAIRHMRALQKIGVLISIDDFGTGYNSITQLQQLPVDAIKIDRSFLAGTHAASEQLIVLIVQAAHAFGLVVVAEGVELASQLGMLGDVGCDSAQGYLIARPLSASAAEEWLRQPNLV